MSAFALTLVQAVSPSALGKVYSIKPDGSLGKKAAAQLYEGIATTRQVPNAEAMKALLIAYDEPPGDGRLAMSCLTIERR